MQETRKISELKNWQDNPREASKADMDNLRWGLKKYGMLTPLLILDDGTVIGGNHRLDVLREMGVKDAWVNVVHPKNKAEMIEIAMLDNQQTANWINDKLAELVNKYKDDIDIERIKIETKSQTLDEILREFSLDEIIEDEVPEVSDEPAISKLGEVYQLGRHRLMCGDATKIEDVEKLMDGKKADMVFTDPPYNIAYEGNGGKKRRGILNDKMSKNSFYQFLYDAIVNLIQFNDGSFYICMGHKELDTLKVAFEEAGGHFQSYVIWVKNKFTLSGSDYQNQYEAILYGWVKDQSHYFLDDRGQGVVWYEVGKKAKYIDGKTVISVGTTKLILDGKVTGIIQRGKRRTDVWEYNRPNKSKEHPTMKPIRLITEAIKNSSLDDDLILDTFLGSGSTLIACEQTNRTCYGMELDEKYLDVVRKRWAKYVYPDRWEDEWQTLTPSSHL